MAFNQYPDWHSRTMFLHKATGLQIIDKQNEINANPNKAVIATTIFARNEFKEVKVDKNEQTKIMFYDAFIYYKDKFANIIIPKE